MRQWEIQKAIYEELSTFVPLTDIVKGVYDDVPEQKEFPYVNIGEDTAIAWDTDDSDGTESTLTIHTWSRAPGRKECKEIMQVIYGALHRLEISVDTLHTVFLHWEFSETFLDPDGKTRHGVQRFRYVGEEKIS
jgi:hypothetical protein